MVRKVLSLSAAAGVLALAGALLAGEPASAIEATPCGPQYGPECTTVNTQMCIWAIVFQWCSKIETKNYYPEKPPL